MRNSINFVMILLYVGLATQQMIKRVQVDEALLSLDKNINNWFLTTNNKYIVL